MYFAIATEECTRYIVADYTRDVDVIRLISNPLAYSFIHLFIYYESCTTAHEKEIIKQLTFITRWQSQCQQF